MRKAEVRDYWDRESCGEVYATGRSRAEEFASQSQARYALEPYLPPFARFVEAAGQDLLEIGVGMGADHFAFAQHGPSRLIGIDLTTRALAHTRDRFADAGRSARLAQADAERLPFADGVFDLVFSWGVLHHTPDTAAAINEVHRVLRRGGRARLMLYHRASFTVDMLWLRFALLAGRPWRSRSAVASEHLESPGTQVFSRTEAAALFKRFARVAVQPQLAFSDLLEGAVGQRHPGAILSVARAVWPRPLIRRAGNHRGFNLLIEATK